MDHSKERTCKFFKARRDPAIVLDFVEEHFNRMSFAVYVGIVLSGFLPIRSRRYYRDLSVASFASSSRARRHTPRASHLRKRVYTLCHGPYSDGRSRHGAPVRRIRIRADAPAPLSRQSDSFVPQNLPYRIRRYAQFPSRQLLANDNYTSPSDG